MEQAFIYLFTGYLAVMNIIGFALMGIDKRRAIKKAWRIPEKTLLTAAFAGGGIGAFLGMLAFHHKTRHIKFTVWLPVTAAGYLILILKLYSII